MADHREAAPNVATCSQSAGHQHETESTSHARSLSSPNQMTAPRSSQAALAQTQLEHNLAADMDPNSQQLQPQTIRNKLSLRVIYNKHFTKLVDSTRDPEKESPPAERRFSPSSRGFIIASIVATTMLFGIIAAVVALTVDRGHARSHELPHSDGPPRHSSPIRAAIVANFPDPALVYHDDTWYAYATNNAAGVLPLYGANASRNTVAFGKANVQMATSKDFIHWEMATVLDEPLPTVGAWSRPKAFQPVSARRHLSSTWAPGLIQRDDGKYVMYYSAGWRGANPYPRHPHPHCVGAAISDSPAGPFEALEEPLACPVRKGGAIDPEAIRDVDGTIWVTWKVDGNNIGRGGSCGNMVKPQIPTPIILQQMKADGVTPVGKPIEILDRIEEDGPLVEAPMIVRSEEGIYFLFFSSGCTRSPSYTLKYATAKTITGPYRRAPKPLLRSNMYGLMAPGSAGIAQGPHGKWNMAFHARVFDDRIGGIRAMFTTGLEFSGSTVTMVQHKMTASE